MHQFRKRQKGLATIKSVFDAPEHALVIHYSCENFYNRPQGRSPRVTSIAVRNLATAATTSFSIHQVAERKQIAPDKIDAQYDLLERAMLDEFYEFVSKHLTHRWLHWNMRDINYGFPALAHRYKVLGGTPTEIPEERVVDVSRLLIAIYGVRYAKHPRLENLIKGNDVTVRA